MAYILAYALPPTIQEVYFRLRCLNTSKAPHHSDVPTRLLKEFALELSGPVIKIFNKCMQNDYFPDKWKCASVCVMLKTPRVTECDQLRPIKITFV